MKAGKNNYLKGFTLVEMLIGLILTSIAITFSYSTLSYIQKIFSSYKDQNRFINEYCRLKDVLEMEVLKSDLITMKGSGEFSIQRDSILTDIFLEEKRILIKRKDFCDTFHFAPINVSTHFETMNNRAWANRLVKDLHFEIRYDKQKLDFYFDKKYDASIKMKLNMME